MSKTLLQVNDLSWQVAGQDILSDINFAVTQGQFVGVIGTNGSGKTSLLRTLYRYTKPSSGKILLQQQDIWRTSASRVAQQIAVVTQAPDALNYNVIDVVAMGLTPHKQLFSLPTAEEKQQLKQALDQVDLLELADHNFDTLSGGEKQRALIARAIVQQGQLLIMDEPTNHLDIHYQIDILNRVKRLGTTVIASLHDLNIASAFCDQLILLSKGKIIATGTPQQVLTEQLISQTYQVDVSVTNHPRTQKPHLLFHYESGRQEENSQCLKSF